MFRSAAICLCVLAWSNAGAQVFNPLDPGQGAGQPQAPAQPGQVPGALQGMGNDVAANNAAAPAWVKEGMRLTYKSAVATTVNQVGAPGAGGGAGVYTVDIVALARGKVGLETRFYVGGPDTQQPATLSTTTGTLANASSCDFWIHPDQLARMLKTPPGGVKIAQMPLEINGRQIQTIRIQTGQAQPAPAGGAESTGYYEPASGVLVQQLTKTIGAQSTQSSIMTMVEMRERKLPWSLGRPPSWLAKFKKYTYTGGVQFFIPGSDIQVPPTPVTIMYEVTGNGPNYIVARQTVQAGQAGGGGQSTLVFGPTQFCSIYLPPIELRQLRQGQVLDEDKTLGTRLVVSGVGQAAYGRNVATIVEDGPGYTQVCDYELETGILLAAMYQNKSLNQTVQVALSEVR